MDLLDAGVPVDIVVEVGGSTALSVAASKNRTDVTQVLLERGADVDKRSGLDHSTALHTAVRWDSFKVIEVLLKHGASIQIKDDGGQTPMDLARQDNNETAVRLLERH